MGKTAGVGVGKDKYGLKDVSETTAGYFKPGVTHEEVNTDWQKSAGDFSCSQCGRKRLPASEFSKRQVEKMLESLRSLPDRDMRTGPDIQHVTHLVGVCKQCTAEKEERERGDAEAKRAEREKAAGEALELPTRTVVSLTERPFGITPSKADGVGYLVAKVSEGKPASKAGVRLGWRLVAVNGEPCKTDDLEQAQQLLKGAELPVQATFDELPANGDFCTACQLVLSSALFSRKMRTKPPEKRRCSACVEAADGAGDAG